MPQRPIVRKGYEQAEFFGMRLCLLTKRAGGERRAMSYFEDPRLLGDGSAWSIYQALSQFISQFKLIDFTGLMLFVQCYDRGGPMYSAARHIVSEFEFHFALIPDDMGSMMAAMRFFSIHHWLRYP